METTDIAGRIEALEQEIAEKRKQIVALQKQSTGERVQDYELRGPNGAVKLSELFGDKDDLIIIHNMGSTCAYCTLWADGFNGMTHHFADRAAFAVVSPETPEKQAEFAASRGWRFPIYSARESDFTFDMGFKIEQNGQWYVMPGFSTFRRQPDGTIVRVGKDAFGPGDFYCGIFHMFDLLDGEADSWGPRLQY